MKKTALLILVSLLICLPLFSQEKAQNAVGIRMGLIKNIFLDQSISYKSFSGYSGAPFQIRYVHIKNKNHHVLDLFYGATNLATKENDDYTLFDATSFEQGAIRYSFLREKYLLGKKMRISLGGSVNANGFFFQRELEKTNTFGVLQQQTYGITYFSLHPGLCFNYQMNNKTSIKFLGTIPIVSLSPRMLNKGTPDQSKVVIESVGRRGGLYAEFSIKKKFKQLGIELFHFSDFINYKLPLQKKILTNKTGIGLYYEL